MKNFLIDIGWSHTLSFMIPYTLMILVGIILAKTICQKSSGKVKYVLAILLFVAPFTIYFALNPIYTGDFSNNYKSISQDFPTIENNKLTVLSIPGCPYCYESIDKLALIEERVGDMKTYFTVLTSDTTKLNWYKEKSDGRVEVQNSENFEELSKLSKGRYPTFVLKTDTGIKVWANDDFGVRALDFVEDELK